MDVLKYNQAAWNHQVKSGCKWTVPVTSQQVAEAKEGEVRIVLTPTRVVPSDWFPPLNDADVLGLACGGGQQCPLLSAAGANVTVFDNSPAQLERDREVAERESLELKTVQGDMRDLSCFANDSFDLVFHPCSVSFIPDVQPVFDEVHRVLRPGGTYLFGACNPLVFIFDYDKMQQGELDVRYSIPYSDLTSLSEETLQQLHDQNEPVCFGHSLEQLIGGQLQAGLKMTGFFEDRWGDGEEAVLDHFIHSMFATRAIKPS
ncbi:MAG: class I SAM-dependent methyltransferase [Planctomycetota bacterium]